MSCECRISRQSLCPFPRPNLPQSDYSKSVQLFDGQPKCNKQTELLLNLLYYQLSFAVLTAVKKTTTEQGKAGLKNKQTSYFLYHHLYLPNSSRYLRNTMCRRGCRGNLRQTAIILSTKKLSIMVISQARTSKIV